MSLSSSGRNRWLWRNFKGKHWLLHPEELTMNVTLEKDGPIDKKSLNHRGCIKEPKRCHRKSFVSPEFFSGPDLSRIPPKSFGHIRRNFRFGDQKYKFFSPEKTTSEDELISSGLFRCDRISISVSGMGRVLETKK